MYSNLHTVEQHKIASLLCVHKGAQTPSFKFQDVHTSVQVCNIIVSLQIDLKLQAIRI